MAPPFILIPAVPYLGKATYGRHVSCPPSTSTPTETWTSNQTAEPLVGFGAKTVKIEYSTDSTAWTPLANVAEFAQASGRPSYKPNTIVSFPAVPAKLVKLTIEKGWGVTPSVGLSEVRFFYIPSASVTQP
ncbi:MAG: hypothetical protein A2Y76_02225 [Planctomycetes bacterium RBG_13_60_9]|nr:MAG: hypothetical protein A2Y76_02225 [Planctomycetes bacterium RBG_13_60_9]